MIRYIYLTFDIDILECSVDDHTRVKLSEPSGEPPSDYINASYLKVCE